MKHFPQVLPHIALLCLLSLTTCLLSCSHADAPALPAPITRPTWAVLDPLTRLLPIDTYSGKTGGTLTLDGGRDEVADAQIAFFAAAQPWQGVRLQFSHLIGPNKSVIGAEVLRWRRIASVRTQQPNFQTRYVGLWPDPLLPAAPFDVQAHGREFAWINLHIPANAKAGVYKGALTLSSSGQPPQTVPVSVRVWGYQMPRQSHLRTAFGMGYSGKFPLDNNAVIEDLLAHRLTPTNAVSSPRRAPGQPDGVDWTEFDRSMEKRLAQGMTGMSLDSKRPEMAGVYQQHLMEKGWLKYAYLYAADEPPPNQYPALNQNLGAFKKAAPLIPMMVTTHGYPAALRNVDIWCVAIVTGRGDYFLPANSQREQQRGKSSWWYVDYATQAPPSVNLWTDDPLLDERIWPWLTWKENVDGLLYWSVTNWQNTADPLHDARTFSDANGEGELLYPGADGKPLDSLRLEALRDGMQDYEVLCLLEAGARELQARHVAPALARQAAALCAIDNSLIGDYEHFNPNPQVLLATRARMSQTLEQVVKQLGHAPHIVGRPVYRPAGSLVP